MDLLWHLQTRIIEEAKAVSLFLGTAVASSLRSALVMGLVYLHSDERLKTGCVELQQCHTATI